VPADRLDAAAVAPAAAAHAALAPLPPRAPRSTDPFVDAGRAVVLLDTHLWGPAWIHHGPESPWIAPTLDLAVQFHRSAPACEWLLCDAVSPVAAEGLVGARASLWDIDGRLLASASGQLFCKRAPAGA